MSTLIENVSKVTAAHAALKEAIASKGVAVPEGTKLTDMPALVEQISTEPVPTNPRAVFAYDLSTSIVVPKLVVVDVTDATDLSYSFSYCSLTSLTLPAGFGQKAKNLSSCFLGCKSLTPLLLPAGFGQAAKNIYGCFYGCKSLTQLAIPDGFGQNAEHMHSCFQSCTSLKSLTLPAGFGQNGLYAQSCFSDCTSLTSLSLPAGFGQKALNLSGCFTKCTALKTITGNPNFKTSFSLSDSTELTHDSIMVVINGLQTVNDRTLTLGTTNLAKLTDDEKKVATDKGWTLA